MEAPVVFRGRHVEITNALRDYAQNKLDRVEKYLPKITKVMVEFELRDVKDPAKRQLVEITIWTRGHIFRGEEVSSDMYAAIDLALDNIERQLRRYKKKLVDRHHDKAGRVDKAEIVAAETSAAAQAEQAEGEKSLTIVKTKRFDLKPMSAQEACLQMALLGHDFYVFNDAESGRAGVVYRRKDGQCGLIEQG